MKPYILMPLIAALFLAACASPQPPPPFSLAGTKWTLVSLTENGTTLTPAAPALPTLNFSRDGRVSGTAGCNSFGGSFQTQGEIISFADLTTTLMACLRAETMDLESKYMNALGAAQIFERRTDQLTITYADGKGRLVFRPQ